MLLDHLVSASTQVGGMERPSDAAVLRVDGQREAR
jgi:hypothetical protein